MSPGFESFDGIDEQRGQTVRVAPTQLSALQRFRCVRKTGRDARKIGAAFELRHQLLGARARCVDAIARRVFRYAQQNLRNVDLFGIGRYTRLRGDEVFQLAVRNLNARIDLALAQPIQDDVLPNVVAKLRKRNAVGFEPLPQRLHRQAVGLCDAPERRIDRRIVDPHTRFARQLHLRTIDDHPLEHLALEHVGRRRLNLLAPQLHFRDARPRAQLIGGDDFIVDDRDDAVDRPRSGAWRRRCRCSRRGPCRLHGLPLREARTRRR